MKTIMLSSLFLLVSYTLTKAQTVSSLSQLPTTYMQSIEETKVLFVEDSSINKMTLHVFNPNNEKIRIYLYKDGMRLCYYTSLKEFSKPFNFSNAEDGTYTLKVCKGSGSITRKITIDTKAITKEGKLMSR